MSEIEDLRAEVERLRAALEMAPVVKIEAERGKPTKCKVWVGGFLRFDGFSYAALATDDYRLVVPEGYFIRDKEPE